MTVNIIIILIFTALISRFMRLILQPMKFKKEMSSLGMHIAFILPLRFLPAILKCHCYPGTFASALHFTSYYPKFNVGLSGCCVVRTIIYFVSLEGNFDLICFKPLPIGNTLIGDYIIRLPRSVDCVIHLPRSQAIA